ncbi:hypothetical protein WCX18_08265 [Sulfurimonas sp. HSL1-2]|uniref:hypothetical protein n=1 Tax=Thiomicrolovo zhangzhouensis TaxID=3131933 RepID=UPI0031F88573
MKRIIPLMTLLALLTLSGYGADTKQVLALYRDGDYLQACKSGLSAYYAGSREAHFAAMVGMACAKSDMINPLGDLQRPLVTTPSLRSTATFFATLQLAKRLLYQHFVDGLEIKGFTLPKYDHILSIVYDHVSRGDYTTMEHGEMLIVDGQRNIIVSLSRGTPPRVLVDEYEAGQRIRRHWYK